MSPIDERIDPDDLTTVVDALERRGVPAEQIALEGSVWVVVTLPGEDTIALAGDGVACLGYCRTDPAGAVVYEGHGPSRPVLDMVARLATT